MLGSYILIKCRSKGLVLPCLDALNLVKLFFVSVAFLLCAVLQKHWSCWSVGLLFFVFHFEKPDAVTENSAGRLFMYSA